MPSARSAGRPSSAAPRLGQALLALGVIGFGVLVIAYRDLALVWSPPASGALGQPSAWLLGAALVAVGVGLVVPRGAQWAALAMAACLLVEIVLARIPTVARHPASELAWYAIGEPLFMAAGALAIHALTAMARWARLTGLAAQAAFALALVPIGLSHFAYLDTTAQLIPAWIPFRLLLAGATGAAHLAAGLAVGLALVASLARRRLGGGLARMPQLAAWLEGVMMALFTLVIWIPAVIHAPHDRDDWSELFTSVTLTGAALTVAALLRRRT